MRGPTQVGLRKLFLAAEADAQTVSALSIEGQFDASAVSVRPASEGHLLRVAYLGVAFLVIFVGFLAPQGLVTVLFPQAGFSILAIIYYVFALASLLAPLLSRVSIDPKWSMWAAALLGYCFWVGSMLASTVGATWVIYFSSAVLGIAAGALWISEGLYVSRSRCGERGHNLFLFIFQFGSCISNLISGKCAHVLLFSFDLCARARAALFAAVDFHCHFLRHLRNWRHDDCAFAARENAAARGTPAKGDAAHSVLLRACAGRIPHVFAAADHVGALLHGRLSYLGAADNVAIG